MTQVVELYRALKAYDAAEGAGKDSAGHYVAEAAREVLRSGDRYGEYRYNWSGQDFKVVIAGDVVSIPGWAGSPGWSMGGFGAGPMSIEWLMSEGGLPGPKGRKLALAEMIRRSLAAHHGHGKGGEGDADKVPMGPFMPCPTCTGTGARMRGFVLATPGYRGQVLIQERL